MKKNLMLIFTFFVFVACNSDNDVEVRSDEPKGIYTLNIKYQGNMYNVLCENVNDSIVFLDKEFESFYLKEIAVKPDLATLLHSDGTIEYFDNIDAAMRSQNLTFWDSALEDVDNQDVVLRRSPYYPPGGGASAGKAILWDDTNYKDRTVEITIGFQLYFAEGNLKNSDGFNDKTSALRVWSYINNNSTYKNPGYIYPAKNYKGSELRVVFLGYENSGFNGRALICIPPNGGVHEDPRLKNVPCDSGNWNDRISSCILRIAEKNMFTSH